ncbi:MAG TPA: cohesin domain-containing protein, partial [Gemmatimonadaceae bacterium]|nr:cohesin domain-containing protein [Gemmatimonadaceae bacterium]
VIKDANGTGVPGVTVVFALGIGGGTVSSAASTQTDQTGTATAGAWTLGTATGANTLTASATGVPGSPVTFTAAATAGPTATLTKIGSDPAAAPAGGNIDSIVVRAADQFGNPVAGQTVAFTVTAGGGSVSPVSRATLADGRAAARWTLGSEVDAQNTVVASRPDGSLPVTFTTVGVRAVAGVRFSERIYVVDSLATLSTPVTAVDANGAPINGASVSLATRSTGIASAGTASVTGVAAGQTFLVGVSADNAAARDSALVIVANVGAPVVRMDVPRFDLKSDTTFTVSLVVDMRGSGALGATTLNLVWDPAVLSFVGEQPGAAAGAVEINTTAAPTGFISIGFASGSGVAGAAELRKLTFKASATAGRSGTLTANVVDLSSTGTFANLAPRTVSGVFPVRTR